MDQLSLVLSESLLVKLIWRLEVVSGHEEVQMKGIFRIWAVVNFVKNVSCRSSIVLNRKLGSIKKAAGTLKIEGHKISPLSIPISQRCILVSGSERSV